MYLARCGPHIVHDGLSHDLQNTREKQTSAPLPSYLTLPVEWMPASRHPALKPQHRPSQQLLTHLKVNKASCVKVLTTSREEPLDII